MCSTHIFHLTSIAALHCGHTFALRAYQRSIFKENCLKFSNSKFNSLTHTHTKSHKHSHTNTATHTHTHTHSLTNICTHVRTHAHTHTHSFKATQLLKLNLSSTESSGVHNRKVDWTGGLNWWTGLSTILQYSSLHEQMCMRPVHARVHMWTHRGPPLTCAWSMETSDLGTSDVYGKR